MRALLIATIFLAALVCLLATSPTELQEGENRLKLAGQWLESAEG